MTSLYFLNDAGDIGKILADKGHAFATGGNLGNLINKSPENGAIFAINNDYPAVNLTVSEDTLKKCAEKNVRLFLECPLSAGALTLSEPRAAVYERAVVVAGAFAGLPEGSLFMPCGAFYYTVNTPVSPLITLAKVAGYDSLAFELPDVTYPFLFAHPSYPNVLISTGCLSRVVTARARPSGAYRALWNALFKWAGLPDINIDWVPDTGPSYGQCDALPPGAPETAFARGVRFFTDNMIFRVEVVPDMFTDRPGGNAPHLDVISRDYLMGGVLEGYESGVDHNGRQRIRNIQRGDCIGETSMVMALDAVRTGSPETRKIAVDIADYVLSNIFFQNDPENPMYGLNNWFINGPVFYGDDNARVIMGVLCARSLLGVKRWDERLLKCALANLRTSAKTGFRHNALRASSFETKNWTDYADDDALILPSPHYQCYIWAVYLWMYALTDYKPFHDKSLSAITICMDKYPDGWRWTNSLTAEMSRMLLPLAFLTRVDDTEIHREWLRKIAYDVIRYVEPCGAVRDMFGDLKMGKYPPPQSNASYGTTEASLIQQNGDPATDLLYTANWAYIGLHEAALVLNDKNIKEAVGRMTDFYCRIQVSSKTHPYLDGSWMRSFDFKKWEYWGSSADIGWGAWCVQSGWVNTWICAAMYLSERDESLFNLSARDDFKAITDGIITEMETDNTRGRRVTPGGGLSAMPGAEQ